MTFHLIFCLELSLPSKSFHFFQMFHQMQAGSILHHIFWLLLPHLLIQQLKRSAVCSGIDQFILAKLMNSAHTCAVTLKCRKKWLFASNTTLHSEHFEELD